MKTATATSTSEITAEMKNPRLTAVIPLRSDREGARTLGEAVDKEFPQVDGVGSLLGQPRTGAGRSGAERYDLGWFVACLRTPLLGGDLAEYLPRYRPDSLLARETDGNLAVLLPRRRERIAAAGSADEAPAASYASCPAASCAPDSRW
ncbi:hypothetical protein [Streptomyces blattellae]|uniref:hypothetical protein n=1 Tax=Streptomyces blattellae TaxID=2569855 RepID=UPI0038B41B17